MTTAKVDAKRACVYYAIWTPASYFFAPTLPRSLTARAPDRPPPPLLYTSTCLRRENYKLKKQFHRARAAKLLAQGVSIRKVATATGISSTALHRLKIGATTVLSRPGAPNALTPEVERELVAALIRLADAGVGLPWAKMSKVVRRLAEEAGSPRPTFVAGRDWMVRFLSRNPALAKRLGKRASRARLVNFNRLTMNEWFEAMRPKLEGPNAYTGRKVVNKDDKSFDNENLEKFVRTPLSSSRNSVFSISGILH